MPTLQISPLEYSCLFYRKVEIFSHCQGFKNVPGKWFLVDNYLFAFQNIYNQWKVGSIQNNQVNFIGLKDICESSQYRQFTFYYISALLQINGNINITQWLLFSLRKTAEKVGKNDVGIRFQISRHLRYQRLNIIRLLLKLNHDSIVLTLWLHKQPFRRRRLDLLCFISPRRRLYEPEAGNRVKYPGNLVNPVQYKKWS